MHQDERTFDVTHALLLVRSRALLILVGAAVVAGSALAFSVAQTKQYTATAKILFRNPGLDEQASGVAAVGTSDPRRDTDTNVRLVRLERVASRAARVLGNGATSASVIASVEVTADGATDIASVSATDPDPRKAALIANAFSRSFIALRQEIDQHRIDTARALVEHQIAGLPKSENGGLKEQALLDRSESLRILSSLQTGNAEVVQSATPPSSPSSPLVVRNTVLGGLLGLLLGVGLVIAIDRLDRRLREPEDLEGVYGLPVVGLVPESPRYSAPAGRNGALPERESEAFSLLRAHLRYFDVDRDVRTVLVTSATPGEGKSTVAMYLARAAALMGTSTLLIEADLRRPSIGNRLGHESRAGLGEVLIGLSDASSAVSAVELPSASPSTAKRPVLNVLLAGTLPPNPAQLIESQAMERLLQWSAQNYELVVIDTAPLTLVSDAISLVRKVDGVLIVSRLGVSTRTDARRLNDRLKTLGAPLLGVVANGYSDRKPSGYGYGYYGAYSADVPADN